PRAESEAGEGLLVEGRVDLRHLFGLAGFVARREVGSRLTAEVDPERAEVEALAAVRADLLERREQLRLRLGTRVDARGHLLGRLDLDPAVALEARRGRDQLPDDHVLLQAEQPVRL